jgi:hypothetical protein
MQENDENKLAAWIYNNTYGYGGKSRLGEKKPLFIERLLERFEISEVVEFLEIMDDCCLNCYDNYHPCYCCRDD